MGYTGELKIVLPEEWLKRTSLFFGRRSELLQNVDKAYSDYFRGRVAQKARRLKEALDKYLASEGGQWSKAERNVDSGGLMEAVHQMVIRHSGADTPEHRLNTYDIPHSRYGVLFLLGNVDINMSKLSIGLEGVSAVGNAVGTGLMTDFGKLDDPATSQSDLRIQAGSAAFDVGARVATTPTVKPGNGPMMNKMTLQKSQTPDWPMTRFMFDQIADSPVMTLNPVMLPVTLGMTVSTAIMDGIHILYTKIENAVTSLVEWIINKQRNDCAWGWNVSGTVVKGAIKLVVGKCLESAAPLIGAIMDLGGGIAKTFGAAKDRLGAWWDRRKIVITPGHPEMLADAIESEMTKGMFSGLWSMLKGAAQIALQSFLPGAGNLVSVIVTGVEWLVKFLWRVSEQSNINKFLQEARTVFTDARALTKISETLQKLKKDAPVRKEDDLLFMRSPEDYEYRKDVREINMNPAKGGIIHDLVKFKTFYQKGCEASPLIPMLTLNSGICGSLMTLIKMFDDTSARNVIAQETFSAGDEYFTRLKQYGRTYLQQSGFEFTSPDPYVQGLLTHAVYHHNPDRSGADKLMTFLSSGQ